MKKALNFVILMILLTLVSIVLVFTCLAIDSNNTKTIYGLMRASEIIAIVANISLLLACLFGKFAKNKCFSLAFWINIALIVLGIVNVILNFANVESKGVTYTFSILSVIATAGTFALVILGCAEAVPSVKKFAITTLVFTLIGSILMGILNLLGDASTDAVGGVGFFGSIAYLVGCILFIVLVFKSRKRITE